MYTKEEAVCPKPAKPSEYHDHEDEYEYCKVQELKAKWNEY
jgi:hypothetical protein